jgi:hypothetical protein
VNFLETEFELHEYDDNEDKDEFQSELRDILVTYPQIMGLSVDKNLKKKVDYFIGDDVGLSRQQLKELVLYQVRINWTNE